MTASERCVFIRNELAILAAQTRNAADEPAIRQAQRAVAGVQDRLENERAMSAATPQFSCDRCGATKDLEQVGAGTLCFSCQEQPAAVPSAALSVVRQLLYIECNFCKVWIIAGKRAATEAREEGALFSAAFESGWLLGNPVVCPACAKEGKS